MKITELNLQENGKKYCCKDTNEIFEVEEGNLIPSRKSYCMAELLEMDFEEIKEAKTLTQEWMMEISIIPYLDSGLIQIQITILNLIMNYFQQRIISTIKNMLNILPLKKL